MDLILIDDQLHEIGPAKLNVDIEIGDASATNDFEMSTAIKNAYGFYLPGTEVGGIIEYESNVSGTVAATLRGWTWRGLLTQWIIEPPSGSDYKTVSGEANEVIRSLLKGVLGGFFSVPDEDSGLTIDSYQFKLYTTVLDGLTDMLSSYGYRLDIYADKTDPGRIVQVYCRAVPVKRIDGEYNDDSGLRITYTSNRMGINHLVCMGKGELQERQRVDLYLNDAGNVGQTKYYKGFDERRAYYDYPNAESLAELIKSGTDKLKDLAGNRKLRIDAESVDLNIGDIVVGRYRETGMMVEEPINKKIYRINCDYMTIEYGVKGES